MTHTFWDFQRTSNRKVLTGIDHLHLIAVDTCCYRLTKVTIISQKIKLTSALTFLKAAEAHVSKIFLVGPHLFSSKPLADMQDLN